MWAQPTLFYFIFFYFVLFYLVSFLQQKEGFLQQNPAFLQRKHKYYLIKFHMSFTINIFVTLRYPKLYGQFYEKILLEIAHSDTIDH